jgi:elongation factor P--beta-lysine ligase
MQKINNRGYNEVKDMSMLNYSDCSPDTPVIDAAAERLALKEMDTQKFRDTNEMAGFQRGYELGFREGAEFMRSFYRKRDMRDHLQHIEREKKKRDAERQSTQEDDRQLKPIKNDVTDLLDTMPPMGGFHD